MCTVYTLLRAILLLMVIFGGVPLSQSVTIWRKEMWCIYKMEHAEKGYVDTYVKYGRHLMAFDEHETCYVAHVMWKRRKSPDLSQKKILIQNDGEETCDRCPAMWEKGESVQIFCSRQFFPKDQSQNVFKNVVNCVNLQIFSQPPIFPLRIDHKMCLKM